MKNIKITATHSLIPSRTAGLIACLRWIALLLLCSAYVQGGLDKAIDFAGAIAEMQRFGLAPAAPLAFGSICVELGASIMILCGFYRWLGAIILAIFTFIATLIAYPFWNMSGPEHFMAANAFFEHLGLIGGFLLVIWIDLKDK